MLPWTHYYDDGEGEMVFAFCVEPCETCGQLAQAANGINIDRKSAERLVLTRVDRRYPEQYYDEDTGKCVCEGCM